MTSSDLIKEINDFAISVKNCPQNAPPTSIEGIELTSFISFIEFAAITHVKLKQLETKILTTWDCVSKSDTAEPLNYVYPILEQYKTLKDIPEISCILESYEANYIKKEATNE